jgi:hypothetical protein
LRYCIESARRIFEWFFWISGEVLLFSSTAQTREFGRETALNPGSLDALATLSLQYPQHLTATRLRDFRARLRQGDQVFLASSAPCEVSIVWVGIRSEVPVSEARGNCMLRLPGPSFMIYDAWSSRCPQGNDVRPEVLRAIAGKYADEDLWIYCLRRQPSLLKAIVESGFELRKRLSYFTFLHWFHRASILAPAESDEVLECQSMKQPRES